MGSQVPIFRVKPKSSNKKDKMQAEILDALLQHLIPRSKQEEILREAMIHSVTCGKLEHLGCMGVVKTEWEITQ